MAKLWNDMRHAVGERLLHAALQVLPAGSDEKLAMAFAVREYQSRIWPNAGAEPSHGG